MSTPQTIIQANQAMGPALNLDPSRLVTDFMGYYAPNLLKIRDKDARITPFKANPVQTQVDNILNYHNSRQRTFLYILKARQTGISTWAEGRLFHRTHMFENARNVIIANDADGSENVYNMSRMYLDNLPSEYQPMTKYSSKRQLVFENPSKTAAKLDPGLRSKIDVFTAGRQTSGRSFTFNCMHMSEFAFFPDGHSLLSGLVPALPNRPGYFVIMETTANGTGNFAYDEWKRYKELYRRYGTNSEYVPIFIAWYDDPDYAKNFSDTKQRDHFTNDIMTRDDHELMKRFKLVPEQMWWRQTQIDAMGGDLNLFCQEYPSCLVADTRVSTNRGMIKIAEVSDLDQVTESGNISAYGPQPKGPIYKLRTKAGRILRGTKDHPVKLAGKTGFTGLGDLQPGNKITLRPPRFSVEDYKECWSPFPGMQSTIAIDETWGLFMGFFAGDGSWHRDTISIVCDEKDSDVISTVGGLLERLIGTPNTRVHQKVQGRKGAIEFRVSRKACRESFFKLGMIYKNEGGTGSYKRYVGVPEAIFQSRGSIVRQFLRGLFEADGSASNGRVRFGSSKEYFVRDVQLLLLGFRITSKISENSKKSGCGNLYKFWELNLNLMESIKFHKDIGFVGDRKSSLCPIPSTLGRKAAPIILEDEVLSVDYDGDEITYDLTIKPNHVFSANGILTHNTDEEAFLSSGRPIFDLTKIRLALAGISKPVFTGEISHTGVLTELSTGRLRIWHHPQAGRSYTIGVDPIADGSACVPENESKKEDRASIIIIDDETMTQCAEWVCRIDPIAMAPYVRELGRYYGGGGKDSKDRGEALIVPEVNMGGSMTHELSKDYWNIYRQEKFDQAGTKLTDRVGWRTDVRTKPMIQDFATFLFHNGYCRVCSEDLLAEMRTFESQESGNAAAKKGRRDDRVMAWMIAMFVAGKDRPSFHPHRIGAPELDTPKTKSLKDLVSRTIDAATIDVDMWTGADQVSPDDGMTWMDY